jgi:hypothetical protein
LWNIALLAKHEASLKALRSDDTDGRSPSGKPPRKRRRIKKTAAE